MPSVVATEKCAISEGVNANKRQRDVGCAFGEDTARRKPQRDAQREAEQRVHGARAPGKPLRPGVQAGDEEVAFAEFTDASIGVRATGSVSQRRPSGG